MCAHTRIHGVYSRARAAHDLTLKLMSTQTVLCGQKCIRVRVRAETCAHGTPSNSLSGRCITAVASNRHPFRVSSAIKARRVVSALFSLLSSYTYAYIHIYEHSRSLFGRSVRATASAHKPLTRRARRRLSRHQSINCPLLAAAVAKERKRTTLLYTRVISPRRLRPEHQLAT